MKSVCGRVIDITGARLEGVEFTLSEDAGVVARTTRSDARGFFCFEAGQKGDYTLKANARPPYYPVEPLQIRVTGQAKKCSPKIYVLFGTGACSGGMDAHLDKRIRDEP